jgi:flavoprotein
MTGWAGFPSGRNVMAEASVSNTTKIALGIVVTIVTTAVAVTWKISSVANAIRSDIQNLQADHYGLSAASEQALRMAIENPTLRVPDPRDPSRIITVDRSHR